MRSLTALLISLCIAAAGLALLAQDPKPPEKLVFKAKTGDVPFNHAAHVKHAKGDCKACHDNLWPQSATAPLNYKAAMHKTAEAKHTSCGFCHHAGGAAFASAGNCNKCHVKGTGKT